MLDNIGSRIIYCRSLLGLSRKNLVLQLKQFLSLPTLTSWELNYRKPSKKKIKILIKFFNKSGLLLNEEWILFGAGLLPINNNLKKLNIYNFDDVAFITLNNLKQEIDRLEIFQVNTRNYCPIIDDGDYIGGQYIDDLKIIDNNLCFCIINDEIKCGILNFEKFEFNGIKESFSLKIEHIKIGKILWIAKRF